MEMNEKNCQVSPMLWYWNQPETGRSIEDCELIVKEMAVEKRNEGMHNLHILFV